MNAISIQINSLADAAQGKKCFEEFQNTPARELKLFGMAILEAGMESGKTSIMLIIPDKQLGENIVVQLSADHFEMMAAVLREARQRFKDI